MPWPFDGRNRDLELRDTLPAEYEERMVSSSIDCLDGKGSPDACHAVGEYFAVVKGDHSKAREFYERNCDDRKYAASCFNLGRLLLAGRGGDVDEASAKRRFHQACDHPSGPGCHHLGLLYYKQGDKATGRKFLSKACDLRDAESCYIIGSNLLKIKPDSSETTTSRFSIAGWRRRPDPPRDVLKAQACLEIACDEGYAPACHNLAVLFKHGDDGVEPDNEKFQVFAKRTNDLVQAAGAAQGFRVS